MSPELLGEISAHLEFLGYKVTKDEEEEMFVAKPTSGGDTKPIFTFNSREEGVFFIAGFPLGKGATENPSGFLRFINSGNAFAYVARFVWDVDQPAFFAEACYPSIYDKSAFATFITHWLGEIVRFFSRDHELSKKYFGD